MNYNILEILENFETAEQMMQFVAQNKLCKKHDAKVLNNMIYKKIMRHKLDDKGIDYDDLALFLKTHNVVMSGSFVLQVLCNKEFDKYDLDIFALKSSPMLITGLEKIMKVPMTKKSKPTYGHLTKSTYDKSLGTDADGKKYVGFEVYEFITKKAKIQLIVTPQYKSYEELVDGFDLSCLKNYFDGTTFYIKHPDNIATFSGTYDDSESHKRNFVNCMSRIKKYIQRGISLNFTDKMLLKFSTTKIENCENNRLFVRAVCDYDMGHEDKQLTILLKIIEKYRTKL